MSNIDSLSDSKRLMMKTLGERDFSAQETMHLLLSLKLHSSSFTVVPVSLHGSCKVNTSVGPAAKCTSNYLLDYYGKRKIYLEKVPDIMNINFMQFVSKYKIVKGLLHHRSTRFVPKVFPELCLILQISTVEIIHHGQIYLRKHGILVHQMVFCQIQILIQRDYKTYYLSDKPQTTRPTNCCHSTV